MLPMAPSTKWSPALVMIALLMLYMYFSLCIDDRQALLADVERYIARLDYDPPNCVDSTTEDTPVKNPPRAPKKSKPTKSAKKKAADVHKKSSIARTNWLLDSIKFFEDSDSSEDDEKDVEIKRLKKELEKMHNQRSLSCE